MENNNKEQNDSIDNISIHDIVIVSKYQRTGEDGVKLGYNFYEKGQIGVVIQKDENRIVILLPNNTEQSYNFEEEDKEYYYKVGKGSEIEYEKEIQKSIEELRDESAKKFEESQKLEKWLKTFKYSISFISRTARFIKDFNK